MARCALVLLVALISFALGACGGGSNGGGAPTLPNGDGNGNGNANASPPPASATPDPSPAASSGINEHPEPKATFLGGVALGTDGLVYATTTSPPGINIYSPQLSPEPSPPSMPAASNRLVAQTWPTVPKKLAATGPVVAAGTIISALASSPTTTGGALGSEDLSASVGPMPTPSSFPALVQYDVNARSWIPLARQNFGGFGDRWVSLASPGQGVVFVVANRFTATPPQWVGTIIGFGIACFVPTFPTSLGASAIGPDGSTLFVASDPPLNGKEDPQTNPSNLYAVNTSTGAIEQTIRLDDLFHGKSSHVSSIAAGNDAVWFTDDAADAIGFVPMGSSSAQMINFNPHRPEGITRDSFGRMWFTEHDGKFVGYVTPNGTNNPPVTIVKTKKLTGQTVGSPLGIVGCSRIPGQPCAQTSNVFFVEQNPSVVGDASSKR